MSSLEAAAVNPNKRPLSVTILAWVYIATGALFFVVHFHGLLGPGAFPWGLVIELVEVIAIVCGAFMLRGHDWARWLALAWMVFHVVISAFGAWRELAVHSAICAVIIWILFRPAAARYFRSS